MMRLMSWNTWNFFLEENYVWEDRIRSVAGFLADMIPLFLADLRRWRNRICDMMA